MLLSRPASPAVVPAEAAKRRLFFRSKRGAAERVSLTVADCVYRSRTRSASTRVASECEWTVFRSLANTTVAYSTSVCVLRRVCIRVRVRSLHERTATAQSDHSQNRPPPQHLLQLLQLRYTATHTAPTASRPLSSRPPHSLRLPRPVPPLNRSSVSRVGRALASETSDDGLGPMRATKFGEHFPTPADCLCGPASPRGAVKRRPRPVTASSTALCTGQALCQLR